MQKSTKELSKAKSVLFEKYMQANLPQSAMAGRSIPRRAQDSAAPLSFGQQQMWFLSQLLPAAAVYNESITVHLPGSLDIDALEQSFNEILRRHEAWRTSFPVVDGLPIQRIHPALTLKLPVVDLRHLPKAEREAEAIRLATEQVLLPFDLAHGPLLRLMLMCLDDQDYRLFLTLHHIIFDGWSWNALLQELASLYEAFSTAQPSPLPPLPIQYADFALWQREMLQGEYLAAQLSYWKQHLAGMPQGLELPTDRPRMPVATLQGASYSAKLSKGLTQALKALSRQEGVTLYMTLVAAFEILLHRYSGQDDVVLGSVSAGRTQAETEALIGFFANTLVLRTDLSGNPSFRTLLQRVREVVLEAQAHQEVPFEWLVKALQPERQTGQNPLFQVMLTFDPPPPSLPAGWSLTETQVETGTSKFDLTLALKERGDGLLAHFEYSIDLFDEATIARIAGHWQTLLEGIVADPAQRLSELPLLTEKERQQLLVEWNATQAEYPKEQCVHQLFEMQVERTPEAVAVVFENERLTYRELNARANQLAHHLQRLGVGPEVMVGLCVERSPEMIVGLLGILKAGGVYVPLDPEYPQQRLAFLLADTHMPLLLTQQRLLSRLPEQQVQLLCLDSDWSTIDQQSKANPLSEVQGEHLAYVIYTSGSTGQPKGVLIPHQAIVAHCWVIAQVYELQAEDCVLQFSNQIFDASLEQILSTLLVGARLVLCGQGVWLPEMLLSKIKSLGLTVINLPPAYWHHVVQEWAQTPQLLVGHHLRLVIVGGDRLGPETLQLWQQTPLRTARLLNAYGPTETTITATLFDIAYQSEQEQRWQAVPIGRPLPNRTVYILDGAGNPVPVGVAGELHIGGKLLARGYLNRPELTAKHFIADPFSQDPQARLYKTGDLVRYLPDGTIEFLGRVDQQVKIRGFRIELGEIEAVLSQHPAVREAVVMAREDVSGDKRLVAYIVQNSRYQDPDELKEVMPTLVPQLRSFLKEHLPEYMLPAAFVLLEALPLTPNGKVDRRALPAPNDTGPELEERFVAPRNGLERVVAASWSEVLGIEQVGIHDNFFVLGGHSLLAMQVASRLRTLLHIEVPLRSFFEAPTVAQLAEHISQQQANVAAPSPPAISAVSRETYWCPVSSLSIPQAEGMADEVIVMPMSSSQQGLWLVNQLEPNSPAYNLPIILRLYRGLDTLALEQSLQTLVQRHETLRTTFVQVDEQPMQLIAPTMSVPLTVGDVQDLPQEQREAEVWRWMSQEVQRPFDLVCGPLLRALVLHVGTEEHILLLVMHHIISDGWSVDVFCQELATLYDAFSTGRPVQLPELPMQYADFALWQREQLQDERLAEQLSYWKERLAGAPPELELPTDHPRPAVSTHRGGMYTFRLSGPLSEDLKALSRQEGVTLYMTLVAAFLVLLHRYTRQDDVVIGTTAAGRNQQEIKDLIGYFVNTPVLRTDLSGNPSFRTLLQRVREVVLEAQAHQEVPFESLVKTLRPERQIGQNPLFQMMLTFDPPLSNLPSGWSLTEMEVRTGMSKFDLTLALKERGNGLLAHFEYSTDLFDEASIVRMARHWQTLLEGIVAEPSRSLAQLPLLSEAERHQLLMEWNATQAPYPQQQGVHQLFEAQVERTPEAVAVVFENEQLTYRELNRKANQLAHYLQQQGVGPEVLVGLCVERSLEMVVGLLGILKAGGAYVPMDPTYPAKRLAFMIADSQIPVLLTQQCLMVGLSEHKALVICMDADWNAIARMSEENVVSRVTVDNLVYVIYTSGSTGRPKGVAVEHRQLLNYLNSILQRLELPAGSSFATVSTLATDLGNTAIFPSLCTGGCLHVLSRERAIDAHALVDYFQSHPIDCLKITPSHLAALQALSQTIMPLRRLIIGGESSSWEWVNKLQALAPDCTIFNHYGPTETTVGVLTYRVKREQEQDGRSYTTTPMGRPIANTQIYLLDQYRCPVPIGVPGEVYIGGANVARGYLNRPELTAEKFIPDPFSPKPGSHLYKTGDLARYLSDGNIEFLGRIDDQIKLRGFRIELGEIEAVLNRHPTVQQAVVVAREDIPGNKHLVAYVVLHQGQPVSVEVIQRYMMQQVPTYMVPSVLVILDAFPLTPNGKVDRKALPEPKTTMRVTDGIFVAPTLMVHYQLITLWEELLDVRPIGIRDNFFHLGGHSLLAARLVARIEHVFGKRIALSTLFAGPTIEQLADALQQQKNSDARASVLPVQVRGSKQPFFFLHGDWTGGAFYCFALARALGPDQPFYVLEPYKFGGLHTIPSLEAVAAAHIESLRTIQPEGPYLLGGFCNGGLLAYEMARQLQAAGERVDFLALINPSAPVQDKAMRTISNSVSKLLRLGVNKQADLFLRLRHALRHVYRHLRPGASRVQDFDKLLAIDPRLEGMFPPVEAFYNDYVGMFTWMVSRYETGVYPGKITFYWASEEPFIEQTWLPVTQAKDSEDIENHIVPGTHMSCVTEHTQELAECLSTCVSRVQEETLSQEKA